jgi:Flp pilus assembly protein TadB
MCGRYRRRSDKQRIAQVFQVSVGLAAVVTVVAKLGLRCVALIDCGGFVFIVWVLKTTASRPT